ncbi:MAG: hypothetical protein K9I85_12205 [Saprospiraceae bacterium]|nr:hypothetical protein [Saprospiraceae bacterium]
MLHPAHLHPVTNVDTNKMAWLAWWKERRSDLVNLRNLDITLFLLSGLIFAFAYIDGDVHWGHYVGGCLGWLAAAYFYYRRRTENKVQEWDDIGQLPYEEQCRVVHQQLMDKGKPGWFHLWYLLGLPVFWVIVHMPLMSLVWTQDMTNDLIFGLIGGVAFNFFYQHQKRSQWQKGVDLSNHALAD